MEIQETITEFIKPELLVLIPVLFFIGVAIVKSNTENKFIPFILMGTGIALAIFTAIVQGILVASGAVLVNETAKQVKK